MKEYQGENAKYFFWSLSNLYMINPALHRVIPNTSNNSLLDVGCGHGDFYPLATKKGYKYLGIDKFNDMLNEGRIKYPNAKFLKGDVKNLSDLKLNKKFDVILCNMLFATFARPSEITKVLTETRKLLTPNGKVVISAAHPAFDGYMQSNLFQRKDIKTQFEGYYKEGAKYEVRPKHSKMHFTDYHHTLETYIDSAQQAGLNLIKLDDCRPLPKLKKVDPKYYAMRSKFPCFMVLTFSKK